MDIQPCYLGYTTQEVFERISNDLDDDSNIRLMQTSKLICKQVLCSFQRLLIEEKNILERARKFYHHASNAINIDHQIYCLADMISRKPAPLPTIAFRFCGMVQRQVTLLVRAFS